MSAVTGVGRALRRAQMPEPELAWRGAAFAAVLAVPILVVAGVLRAVPGLLGAALGVALVVGLFGVTGVILVCVARLSPATLPAASLVGALVRMTAYGAILAMLSGVEGVDRASTAVATTLLLFATLLYEARFAARTPGFYWVRPSAPDSAQLQERTTR